MVTRLYLDPNNPIPGVTPSSWSAGWNKTTGTANSSLSIAPLNLAATSAINTASGTSGHFTAIRRYISPPLMTQTISGTVKGQCRCVENATGDNYTLAFAVKVVQSDGSDRGVLVGVSASDDTATAPPEMVTTPATNRRFLNSSESASITLSSLDVSEGDRLVLELGCRQASTSTNQCTLTITSSDALADLGENDTSTSSENTWVEFSADILFGAAYFKSAATPAGNNATATGTADPTAVTPPTGMLAGDLVCMIGHQRATGATLAISEAGGQSWTPEAAIGTTNCTPRLFWCVFNGTWGANPSVDFSATTCNSVQMLVFRPPTSHYWERNLAQVELDIAAAPHTITGQTTLGANPTLTLAGWFTADDNQWGSISGTGWQVAGEVWYINQSGNDQSSTYAYQTKIVAGATGNVTKTQTALGDDASTTFIITWAAVPKPQPPTIALQAATRASFW